jgi:dihydroorotate dehydrogenase
VYSLIRPLLFALDAERSHNLILGMLRAAYRVPGVATLVRRRYAGRTPALPVEIMGLRTRTRAASRRCSISVLVSLKSER